MSNAAELVGATATSALAVLGLIGLAVRFVLFPWLREHLVGPVLERLDAMGRQVERTTNDITVAARMFDGHIDRSADDRSRLWQAVEELRAAIPRHRRHRIPRREDNPQ